MLNPAQFEFAQRVTLETSNILVSITSLYQYRRAKSVGVLPTGYGKSLICWIRPDQYPLVWIRQPLYSSHIFKCMLGAAPRVGPLSLLVARPYCFLDLGLVFQAKPPSIYIIKITQ